MQKIPLFLCVAVSVFASVLLQKPLHTSLIVYNSDLALVQEKYPVTFNKEEHEILCNSVASRIIPASVTIELPKGVTLNTQRFYNNSLSLATLLQSNLGKTVTFKRHSYTLLSFSNNKAVLQDTNSTLLSADAEKLQFHFAPALLTPTLAWQINAANNFKQNLNITYLTRGISWHSDYTLHLYAHHAILSGWASITNNSGKDFHNIALYLLAGNVNVPQQLHTRMLAASNRARQTPFEGYYLYSLAPNTNLANHSTMQVRFLKKQQLHITTQYSVLLSNPYYASPTRNFSVTQKVTFTNKNFSLPAGNVRTYAAFKNIHIFTGEQPIENTPKNSKVSLNIGKPFDLQVKQTLQNKTLFKHYEQKTLRYTLYNKSADTKTIVLQIPFVQSDTAKIKTQQPYQYKNDLLLFTVDVAPNSQKEFSVEFKIQKI
jgi:hypothetical protein